MKTMRKKGAKWLVAMMAAMICMLAFSTVAYAKADDPDAGSGSDTSSSTSENQPVPLSGGSESTSGADSSSSLPSAPSQQNPFTPDGTGTVVDNADSDEGKEFFTITTEDGNIFYLVIDRQREGDNVYFLNAVTESDLMALAEEDDGGETAIPESEPQPMPEPEPEPEPTSEPEPEPEPEAEKSGGGGTIVFIVLAAAAIGGAAWYFKIYKKKNQMLDDADDLEDFEFMDGEDDPDVEFDSIE